MSVAVNKAHARFLIKFARVVVANKAHARFLFKSWVVYSEPLIWIRSTPS